MSVTICLPTIPPRADKLSAAIASVFAQTFSDWALCVSIDRYGKGAADTRNRALNAVETEWTAFLDDDDIMYPRHLERLVAKQNETNADLVYPWFDIEGNPDPLGRFGYDFDGELLRQKNYIPVTYLVRTELAQSVGGFPPLNSKEWPYNEAEDWGFLLKLLDADANIVHLPERSWRWVHWGWGLPGVPGNTSGRADRWVAA